MILEKEFAEIKQIGKEKQDDCVRIWCTHYPDGFSFQIRTFKPISDFNKNAIPRQMIATVNISLDEMRKILAYMEKESKKYETD